MIIEDLRENIEVRTDKDNPDLINDRSFPRHTTNFQLRHIMNQFIDAIQDIV